MLLNILFLFHVGGAVSFWSFAGWLLIPLLLGLLIGYWIWGAYKSLVEERNTKILGLNKVVADKDAEYLTLKNKWESSDMITTKLKSSLAESQSENSSLHSRLRLAEAASTAVVTEEIVEEAPLALVETAVEEPIEEIADTPPVKEVAVAAAATAVAVKAVGPTSEDDKEDDYLPGKEYIGHKVTDKRNNIAFFKHKNGLYYFALYAADGSVRLRSEGFSKAQLRDKELSGVIKFKDNSEMYKRVQKGKYYMDVLFDETGREVGRSCLQKEAAAVIEPVVVKEPVVAKVEEPAVVERQVVKVKRTVNVSGLEDLSGIDAKAQRKLIDLGFGSMTALAMANEADLANRFAGSGLNWRHWWNQSKYATNGDWAKFYALQNGKNIETNIQPLANIPNPRMNINATDPELAYLRANTPNSKMNINATDPELASLRTNTPNPRVNINATDPELASLRTSTPNSRMNTNATDPELASLRATTTPVTTRTVTKPNQYQIYFSNDNLQIIEGVGPKIENILKGAGYSTWGTLANASYNDLKKVMSDAGPRYRIHNPKSWSKQSQLAYDGKWEELINYQKFLENTIGTDSAYSKVEKLLNKSLGFANSKLDDFKIIEGVGPKIESLLKAGGINTWKDLSNASVDKLKLILLNAGNRYRLADPSTWPIQAGMANRREWTKLKEYQDLLQGGKRVS